MFDYLRVAFFEKYDLGRAYHRLTREGLVLMKMPELWQSQFMIFYENPISVQMLFFQYTQLVLARKCGNHGCFTIYDTKTHGFLPFPAKPHVFCVA
jgi:hypothetical protein